MSHNAMQYFFDTPPTIDTTKMIVFFDFDLTLSPLSINPNEASLPLITKQYLKTVAQHIPTAIITGRALCDIIAKVDIPSVLFAGNHGMEWKIGEHYESISIDTTALAPALESLKVLCSQFPKCIIEDKKYTIAFHYRAAAESEHTAIETAIEKISLQHPEVLTRWSKKTFEIRPITDWNKGSIIQHIMKKHPKRHIPLYIGDDMTDEDGFLACKNGISIRVGVSENSAAHWYIADQTETDKVLRWIIQNINIPNTQSPLFKL